MKCAARLCSKPANNALLASGLFERDTARSMLEDCLKVLDVACMGVQKVKKKRLTKMGKNDSDETKPNVLASTKAWAHNSPSRFTSDGKRKTPI